LGLVYRAIRAKRHFEETAGYGERKGFRDKIRVVIDDDEASLANFIRKAKKILCFS
jgi:hypothetical protein